ncbi:MAG: transposase [Candidatus Microthrix sp.]|jgi:transposase-like protein|uniref:Transposase n=1 Tax=Candidatus Neomicrothrix subdominans TaxID=2954438 RepID=A0A936TCB6_9ACTN|nr:transposase [Candidatus Microthrix sp.]MBK6968372.1 transposase [Candidatus Microthrix sp.]MBK9296053.1 transposase [Candidatus Microthrix subdominans]MBP9065563.1 transposase [Candidatus Microthrix sp.]
MTTPDSALNALSASLTAVDSPLAASLAEIVADAIQELIEAELSALIGAEPNERSMSRTNLCNGHRDKLVSTPAGDITVGIPKLRKGSVGSIGHCPRGRQRNARLLIEGHVDGVADC